MKSIDKLPRVVGIIADPQYKKQEWIKTLILQVRPKTIITATTGGGMENMLERLSVLRGDIYFKLFDSDPWEESVQTKRTATRIRDYLFVSYLKVTKGHLFVFPAKYNTRSIGFQYSRRMQDIIILAHQLRVPYDIISEDDE